jgi:hypothetical protein
MCLDCKSPNCQDMGPRASTCVRYERQQYSCLREHANGQDVCSDRPSSTAFGYDHQALDKEKDCE